ncbi:MAG TPA: hypothetical protein VFR19_23200, partial [Hyphomicrobiaceae bacterium]|nr:hypothetical protein [Hyphomicrobiaceae bacterium]
ILHEAGSLQRRSVGKICRWMPPSNRNYGKHERATSRLQHLDRGRIPQVLDGAGSERVDNSTVVRQFFVSA